MTEMTTPPSRTAPRAKRSGRLALRYAAERRFRAYGILAIATSIAFLLLLFGSIVGQAWSALQQTRIGLDIHFDATLLDPDGTRDPAVLAKADYRTLVKKAWRERFPEVRKRRDKRALRRLLSVGAPFELAAMASADRSLLGTTQRVWLTASDDVDMWLKGKLADSGGKRAKIAPKALVWLTALRDEGRLERHFNSTFFTTGDSREPELAGVWGAVAGSFFTLLVCLGLAFPFGVMTAVYLQEFAPRNRWTDLIEVNTNNLAAVPSIVFGLLGLAVLLNFAGLPRSAPLVGGIVLALMTLPTIIIAGRAAMQAVPPSIREAALGVGASETQVVLHHVLPLAMPGILTGTILGAARALGETAPLLMIGMVAFIVDIPADFTDPATALPVQIYLWADAPERAFAERTAAAILVLLGFLVCMNLAAVMLRRAFEQRW